MLEHHLHRLAPSFQPISKVLVSLCSSLYRLSGVRLQGPLGGMRCSAGLQRLARLALSAPHTHGWAAPLAEAASVAGAQSALAPGAACAFAGRRYLWQDGRLAHGASCRGAALVLKGAWRLAGCVSIVALRKQHFADKVSTTVTTFSVCCAICALIRGVLQLAQHMAKVALRAQEAWSSLRSTLAGWTSRRRYWDASCWCLLARMLSCLASRG